MCFRRVPELRDERVAIEGLLDDAALDALAAAVNQPDLTKAGVVRSGDVLLDHRRDISWRERVEVQEIFYRDAHTRVRSLELGVRSLESARRAPISRNSL
jgi:hypothetical protein